MHQGLESRRFSVVVAHRRFGKSVAVVNHLIKQALLCKRQDPKYGYIAPYRNQAENIAWMYLKRYSAPIPGVKTNEQKLEIALPNNAKIRIFGADNPDALRGMYFDGVVMDEVAQMKPDVWEEIIRPALSDRLGWAVFIGTPKGINTFHKLYQDAIVDSELWYTDLFDVEHTDALDHKEIELIKRQQTPNKFRQEYMCDFSADVEDAIIPLNLIIDAYGRSLHQDTYRHAPVVMGVDVARFGDDKSVIYTRKGLATLEIKKYVELDLYHFSENVMAAIHRHVPDAVFIDDVGVGAGVVDICRSRQFQVSGINGGGKASDEMFANKRAEMWWKIREWMEAGGSIPQDTELRQELATPTYTYDPANRIRLEKKEDMKERGLKSPDIADALALTFAQPVAKRKPEWLQPLEKNKKQYDPWAVLNA
jgi:hypothetical protein